MSLIKRVERSARRLFFGFLRPFSVGRGEKKTSPRRLRKILFLRPGKLGDMIAALPSLTNAKRAWPGVEVAVVGSPANVSLLRGNPNVDEVYIYDKALLHLPGLVRRIRGRRYDLIIDLAAGPSFTNAFLSCLFSAGSYRLGLAKEGMGLFYHRNIYLDDALHSVERGMAIFQDIQKELDASIGVHLTSSEKKVARSFFSSGPEGRPKIGINLSAGERSRVWPLEHYRRLLLALRERLPGGEFIVFTQPHDRARGDQLAAPPTVRQIPRGSTIRQAAAIIAHLDLMVSPDTSLIHLAAAFKVPVVGLYPEGEDNFLRWHPFRISSECLISRKDVEDIDPRAVVEATVRLLRRVGHVQKLFSKPRCTFPRVRWSPRPRP